MKKRLLIHALLALFTVCGVQGVHAQELYASTTSALQRHGSPFKPLKKVMEELRDQYGIYFMVNSKHMLTKEVDTRINMSGSVDDVLRQLLAPIGLTFKKVDKIYIIIESDVSHIETRIKEQIINAPNSKLSPYVSNTEADHKEAMQEIAAFTISGNVTDETGANMPGVNILVKGTTIGVVTDSEGAFKLDAPDGNSTLVFTFIGYTPQEIQISNRVTINVQMQPDIRSLSEVVVVGYGTQKRAELTSAVASVKTEEFRQSGARNALDLIQGKVAGLTITRTAGSNPNSSPSIQIRGVVTLTSSTAPLIIVNGIPGGNLDLLQQDDIESIDILKDGSAAAIYGTQANAGVIIVTTKKGKPGPPKIDYSTYARREYVQRIPEFLSAQEFRQKLDAGLIGGGPERDKGHSIDAFDELVNHQNLSQYHNLALSGGSEQSNYRVSVYYQDLQGIAKENSRTQYGLRLSLQQRALDDKFTGQLNIANNINDANLLGGGGWEDQLIRNPTLPIKNDDGSWFFEPTSTNQVARLAQETNRRQQLTSSIDGKATLEFIKGLKGSIFGSVQRNHYNDGAYRTKDSENSVENDTPEGRNGGYAYRGTALDIRYAFEPTIDYARTIANVHSITAIAGYSWRYEVNEGFDQSNRGFINDIFEENSIGTGAALAAGRAGMGSYKNDNTNIAFFGRVNYSFNEKYMVQGILRREGSSRFGDNNKWAMFPAISAGWNISHESFMSSVGFIDDLKVRIGYGVTGNSGIGNYSSRVTMSGGGNYINPDGIWRQTYGPDRNPNPNLRWEKKKELNIGLDFSFLNNRIGGALEVYSRRTEDLLENYTSQLPPYVRELIYTNVGTIVTKGVELTLNGVIINKGDFVWKMDIAASTAKNIMESFSNDVYKSDQKDYAPIGGFGALGSAIRTFEGKELGNFYGKRFAGFDENGKWLFYKRDGTAVPFDQINNSVDPKLSDHAVIGNAIPKYYLSWTNRFTYKNFDLTVFMRGRFGYDILNTMEISYGNKTSNSNLLKSAFTKHAELNDTYQYSDYYLEPGGFMKIDEVTLGYTVPIKSTYVRNLRVYVAGSNLAIFTKYGGNDPDFVNDTGTGPGVDARGPYPSTRSALIGLNVGF